MARDYSSIYNIKDLVSNTLAPKYLNMNEVNDLTVGLLGLITETIGTVAEDSFNTTTTYMNEIFPNIAILPDTIYNDAALFQDDNIFAIPAEMNAWIFISEKDILKYSNRVTDGLTTSSTFEIFLDSSMIIDIESIIFMMDYDIRITYIINNNETIYTAMYDKQRHDTAYQSSLNTDSSPYIKCKKITYNNEVFLALLLKVHQVERHVIEETVINNDVIHAPMFNVTFNDNIATFDIFCKQPDETEYVQLEKKMLGAPPDKNSNFCYYRMINDNNMEISFTVKDGYYKPKFGADIIIDYTTTKGSDGNFDLYTGSDIICTGSSSKYDYNNKLIIFCIPQSASRFGDSKVTLDELRASNVEKYSTVKSYTIENDLQLYFDRFTNNQHVKMYTIKKRNDYMDRLFSSFSIFRNKADDIIKTNTANLNMRAVLADGTYVTSSDMFTTVAGMNGAMIPAGSLFTYEEGEYTLLPVLDDTGAILTMDDYIASPESFTQSFLYTNPFMIYKSTSPTAIQYYMNTVSDTYGVDYTYVNSDSFIQFMFNSLHIERDAISGDDKNTYFVTAQITPTVNVTNTFVTGTDTFTVSINNGSQAIEIGTFNNDTGVLTSVSSSIYLKMMLSESGSAAYINLTMSKIDVDSDIFTLTGTLETDNYIGTSQFRITNSENGTAMIDMENCVVVLEAYCNGTHTNSYRSNDDNITFIKSLHMVKSNITFDEAAIINNTESANQPVDGEGNVEESFLNLVDTFIESVPLVGASVFANNDEQKEFYSYFIEHYDYIADVLDNITTNFSIDIKFYNTYGRSKNFYVEISDNTFDLIDTVDISISFKVKPVYGTDESTLITDLKLFIKKYIEDINITGTNSIYISNMIKAMENQFQSIQYIKFNRITGIQTYGLDAQAIENRTVDITSLNETERRYYVPEYLTISLSDVNIAII